MQEEPRTQDYLKIKEKVITYLENPTEGTYFNLTEYSLPVNQLISIVMIY